jgi:glycerol-3-phosphate dehydrogenase (NAD(P)+)
VAEGVVTAESARELAVARRVEMPIVSAVHRVLFEHQPARQAMVELMSRELRGERD